MALLAYDRLRLFWGAFDGEHDIPAYSSGQRHTLGASAVDGVGVGARRAQLVFSRTPPSGYTEDVAISHFDFVNYTAGAPDDSWTSGDFTTMEGYLNTWWTTTKASISTTVTLREIRWYRLGIGLGTPNPAVRVTANGNAGTSGGVVLPPQCSMSVTFKTAVRSSWGRMYLPGPTITNSTGTGRISTAVCDALAGAVHTMFTSAFGSDFLPAVYSKVAGSMLSIESVQVDDIYDVIRSRRWESTTYRKKLP